MLAERGHMDIKTIILNEAEDNMTQRSEKERKSSQVVEDMLAELERKKLLSEKQRMELDAAIGSYVAAAYERGMSQGYDACSSALSGILTPTR